MRARRSNAHDARRHDKASGSSWWLLLVCALLLAAPSHAAPLSLTQTRSAAQVEAVFALLQSAEAPLESRAALQVLCKRAGLDEISTAHLLSSYERWSHEQGASSTCSAPPSSTCSRYDASKYLRTTAYVKNEAPVRTHARIGLFLE